MSDLHHKLNKIVFNSRELFKKTAEYRLKVEILKNEISWKYQPSIKNEGNLIKKLFLVLKKRKEIKKAINKLTALDKMYLAVK